MTTPIRPDQSTLTSVGFPVETALAETTPADQLSAAVTPPARVASVSASNLVKIRSPWGVWWLSLVTFGIYYLVWYVKVNKEIARLSENTIHVGTLGLWLSQCAPIAAWISLSNTSKRLTAVQQRRSLTPTTTGGMMILSSLWFGSHQRYLQRRLNATYGFVGVAS